VLWGDIPELDLPATPFTLRVVWSALNSSIAGRYRQDCGSLSRSPVTSTTTPVSATAEQEDDENNNQDQFHGASPVDGDGYGAGA
jgi:hypothetical protein